MVAITRKDLYEKVWRSPTTQLSEVLGISDVAIAKLCKKLNVPKPPRGYWEKIKYGHQVSRPPLPPTDSDMPEQATIRASLQSVTRTIAESGADSHSSHISAEAFTLSVNFKSVHPLIKKAREVLTAATKERHRRTVYQRLWHNTPGTLDVRVSAEGVTRALKIMEALILGLESKGYSVLADGKPQPWKRDGAPTTQVIGLDSPVVIYIEELSRRVKYVPPRGELRGSYGQRFDYRPTGKLRLVIDECCGEGFKRQWNVNDDDSLAETLASFFDGLVETAKTLKMRDDNREQEHREFEREQRLAREEGDRTRALSAAAMKWEECQRLQRFLSAFNNEIHRRRQRPDPRSRLGEWLAWAERHIDEMDPVKDLIENIEKDREQDD
jgi:hypothetical protein